MITLTAHLTNGKKYSFEIPEGYPWVEYSTIGVVYAWTEKPRGRSKYLGYTAGFTHARCMYVGRIQNFMADRPQLQRIHFHD